MQLKKLDGDLFSHLEHSKATKIVLPHVCNDLGVWASGFVVPLAKRFPASREKYVQAFAAAQDGDQPKLGWMQIVPCSMLSDSNPRSVWVCNMIAQHGVSVSDGRPPIRYVALVDCMKKVAALATAHEAEIHAPMFGSERAGGNWEFIEGLIQETWLDLGIPVTIYCLK